MAANNLDFMSRSPRPLLLQGAMIFCSPAHAHLFCFGAPQATGTPLRDEWPLVAPSEIFLNAVRGLQIPIQN
jgi:hypothetical protein